MLPEKSRIEEIIKLYQELQNIYYSGLEKAIRLGELLEEQKEKLKYGEFENWVKNNLPFTLRTARNYRMVFKNRDLIKRKAVSHLDSAYLLLSEEKDPLKYWHKMGRAIQEAYNCIDEIDKIKDVNEAIELAKEIGEAVHLLVEMDLKNQRKLGEYLEQAPGNVITRGVVKDIE